MTFLRTNYYKFHPRAKGASNECAVQPFLILAGLAAAPGDKVVHLPSAVPAQLHFEILIGCGGEIRKKIAIFVHGFTRTLYPGACWKVNRVGTLSRAC